jgi:hypothetical protein
LTPLGEQVATRTVGSLSKKKASGQALRKGSRQSISSRTVLRIEKSRAFATYNESGVGAVSDFDFCDLLYCTLGTTPDVLQKNLSVIRQEADIYGRNDIILFLDSLRQRFGSMLVGKRTRGGMMPQKKES